MCDTVVMLIPIPIWILLIIHQFIQLEVPEDIKSCGRQHPV